MKNLLIVLAITLLPFIAFSQTNQGKIVYDITEIEITKDKDFFQGNTPTLEYLFMDKIAKIESEHPTQGYIIYSNGEENIILVESMGQKNAYVANTQQLASFLNKTESIQFKFDAEKLKTILGYQCDYFSANLDDGTTIELYATSEIQPMTSVFPFAYSSIEGFPLRIEITKGNKKTSYTASLVTELTDRDMQFFDVIIPEDYDMGDIEMMLEMKKAFKE